VVVEGEHIQQVILLVLVELVVVVLEKALIL
jgi:hypothetical protein